MNNNNTSQRKTTFTNLAYALLVGLLIVGASVVIAYASSAGQRQDANIGGESIIVSGNTYVLPLKDATVIKDYSKSELQYNVTLKQWEIHKAVDLTSASSNEVMAVADGTVSNVYTNYLEGTVVEISHKDGVVTVYKSLSEANVKTGDKVTAGQKIGTAGETMAQELKQGAHLHFEMLIDGVKVNPNDYLSLGDK